MLKNIEKEIENTQIIILAAGAGSRIGNIDIPKPLLEVGDKTLLYYCIKQYSNLGFREFKLSLGYKAQDIIDYVKKENFGVDITYSVESEGPKGKAKTLKYAIENNKINLKKRGLICFPDDYFFDPNLPINFLLQHILGVNNYNTLVTICYVTGTIYPFGVSEIDSNHLVSSFEEKPFIKKNTNTGLYIVEPEFFREVAKKIDYNSSEKAEIEDTIFPTLALNQKIFSMTIPSSLWAAVNTMKELEQIRKRLSKNL